MSASVTQEQHSAWQRAVDIARAKGYYAFATALTEDGPRPGIDYEELVREDFRSDEFNPEKALPSEP